MSQVDEGRDAVSIWKETVGNPLEDVLRQIRSWAREGGSDIPRAIGFLELKARAEGYLHFDGTGYVLNDWFAEITADHGKTLHAEVFADLHAIDPVRTEEVLGSTINFDLADQIARQNQRVGYPIPEALGEFVDGHQGSPKRPRGRGDDAETRILRDRLSAWAIQRGVDLGLKPSRNRILGRTKPHSKKVPCMAELVLQTYHAAKWFELTEDAVLSAYRDLHYGGSANQRRLQKSLKWPEFEHQFKQFDVLIPRLSS